MTIRCFRLCRRHKPIHKPTHNPTHNPRHQPTHQPTQTPISIGPEPTESDLVLNNAVYMQDGYGTKNVIRVDIKTTTTPGNCTADDLSGCTLADVLADVDGTDDFTVDIPVHFSSDDFPDDGSMSNAELRLRGGGSRQAAQKSFRIKLDSKDQLWRNERHLQLNKHPFESTRIRNKLAFDAMSTIPHLPSFRTQFVNLWIDDGTGPTDYGLYTHVERPNNRYLENHGLDPDGNLYKAERFTFDASNLQEIAVDSDGAPLNKDNFEAALSIEEGKDHRPLVEMMTALHDPNIPFEDVLDKYFNRNNLLAWISANILFRQTDASSRNYLLYNPSDSIKFYFLPWDYDSAMGVWFEPPNSFDNNALHERLHYGYAAGNGNEIMSNFYKLPGMHETIMATVETIRQNYVTDTFMTEQATLLTELVQPFETMPPDNIYNPEFNADAGFLLANSPAENAEALNTRFSIPMPSTLLAPVLENDQWKFSWKPAFDVTGNTITYDIQIARSIFFGTDEVIVNQTNIENSSNIVVHNVPAALLPTGEYFVRLVARTENEPNRFWQVATNFVEVNGVRNHGVLAFNVP